MYDTSNIVQFGLLAFLASVSRVLVMPKQSSQLRFFAGSFTFGLLLGFLAIELPQFARYASIAAASGGAFGDTILRRGQQLAGKYIDSKTPTKQN